MEKSSQSTEKEMAVALEGATAKGYVSTEEAYYFDPKKVPPPKGAQIILLTIGGIAVKGSWRDDGGYVGWYPLPKIPSWARESPTASREVFLAK